MQVVRFRGFQAAAGETRFVDLRQHDLIRGKGGTHCKGYRLSARTANLSSLCSLNKNYYTAVSSKRAWASSTLLSTKLHMTEMVLARADSREGDAPRPEKPKREITKEWESIPSTIYRPFSFPNLEEYARGLNSWQRIWHGVGFLAVLAGVAWGRNLGVAGLWDDTEPLFVEAARQMMLTGDYITPQFNAAIRLHEPVFVYWLMAFSAKIFGDHVWAYRLPSCLLAMGLLGGLYLTVLRFGLRVPPELNGSSEEKLKVNDESNFLPAIITAAAFALNLGVMTWGSVALSDMLRAATVGASLLSFFWGYVGIDNSPGKNQNHYLLSAAFLGLAHLTNGPAGILLPLCACASFLLCTGDMKQVFLKELPVVKGILIMAIINLPWHGMMYLRHGLMFVNASVSNLDVQQWLTCLIHQHRVRPWLFALVAVLIMYFPWSLSLPSAVMKASPWKDSVSWKLSSRSRKLVLFAATWFVSGVGLLALTASHLSSYLLVGPAAALLAASHLSLPASSHENGVATGLAPALIYQILAGVVFLFPGMQQGTTPGTFAAIGGQLVDKHYHKIAFVILATAGMLATRTEEYSVAYGSKHLKFSNQNVSGDKKVGEKTLLPLWILHTCAMFALLGLFVTPSFRLVDNVRQAPLRQLALRAAQVQQPGEELLMVGVKMPSVVYYSQLPTSFVDSFAEAVDSLQKSSVKAESVLVISSELWKSPLESTDLCQEEEYRLTRVILPRDKITSGDKKEMAV